MARNLKMKSTAGRLLKLVNRVRAYAPISTLILALSLLAGSQRCLAEQGDTVFVAIRNLSGEPCKKSDFAIVHRSFGIPNDLHKTEQFIGRRAVVILKGEPVLDFSIDGAANQSIAGSPEKFSAVVPVIRAKAAIQPGRLITKEDVSQADEPANTLPFNALTKFGVIAAMMCPPFIAINPVEAGKVLIYTDLAFAGDNQKWYATRELKAGDVLTLHDLYAKTDDCVHHENQKWELIPTEDGWEHHALKKDLHKDGMLTADQVGKLVK